MTEYAVTMSSDAVRLIAKALAVYSERWPGGDPGEQETIWLLQAEFQKMIFEDLITE